MAHHSPKVLLLSSCTEAQADALRKQVPEAEILHVTRREDAEQHLHDVNVIAGFIGYQMIDNMLDGDHQLEWIQTWSAGVNNYPLDRLYEEGIMITNASGVHNEQISEVIIGSMIGLARRFPEMVRDQAERRWNQYSELETIHGKTMTILGAGSIGKETARLGKAFGMHVKGLNSSGNSVECFDEMGKFEDLSDLLEASDYIVNILPESEQTAHMINAETIAMMKDGAYYINVGRGKTTDTQALMEALDSGKLKGAALDVFEEEPLPEDHPLWEYRNVMIMPHVAGNDVRYNEKALKIFGENLRAYVDTGKPAINLVEEAKGY